MLSSEENSRLYAYNGNEPYIFVSYAHKDSDIVLPIVHYLQQEGFRIWFDLGIESGTEWSNVIADHLTDCAVFLAFVSKSSVISENCLDELAFAKSHRKPSLMVFLEDDVVLPKGAEMQTARFQRMYRSRYQTDDYFCRKLCDTPMLAVCHDIPETPKSDPIPASAPTETPAAPEKHRSAKTSRPQKRNIKLLLPAGILAVFLLAVGAWFLLSGPKEQVSSIPGDDSYGLELIASFSDPDHSVSLSSSIIYDTTDDPNTITLLNRKGESITNAVYRSVDALGNGLYTITSGEAFDPANPTLSAVNNISLVRDTGKVLIPVEACLIQRPSSSDADGRYLYVFYATAPAGESDVLISKNEHGTYTSSVSDSVDYSGYIKIFDTKTEKFLDKLPTITSLNAVKTCGDSILIKNQKVHTLYSAEGNAIGEFSGSVDVGKDFFILRDGSASRIYDSQGNQLFTANKNISIISGGHYLSVHQSGDSYILMDIYGNHLLDTPYSSFYKESADIFIVKNSGKYGLVTLDGTEIAPCRYDYISTMDVAGYFCAETSSGYTLFGPEGIIATKLKKYPSNLAIVENQTALVINNRGFLLDVGTNYLKLTDALLAVASPITGLYGVYDLFTGSQLLPDSYETVEFSSNCLYAYQNGTWEVYEISYFSGS